MSRLQRHIRPPATLFALEITKIMVSRRLNNLDIHRRIVARGFKGSSVLVDRYTRGDAIPAGEVVEHIGRALELPDGRITALHRAAAMDLGYRVVERVDG